MTLKIWSKQLLYIKPDPTPYLLASRTPTVVRLNAASGIPFLYTNTSNPAKLITDTLSNKNIGYGAFDVSFVFAPDKTASYRELFTIPGLCKFTYNWNAGQGLLFYFEGLGWRAISTDYIPQNEVEIRLYRADSDSDVILKVGTYTFTLAKAWTPWTQPGYEDFGGISWSANPIRATVDGITTEMSRTSTQYNQYAAYVSKPYGSDTLKYAQRRYHVSTSGVDEYWFTFKTDTLLRIHDFEYSVGSNESFASESEALAADMIMTGDYGIYLYDTEDKGTLIDGPFTLQNKSALEHSSGGTWMQYDTVKRVLNVPFKTKTFCIYFDVANAIFLGYTWDYYGSLSVNADRYIAPAFKTGQLVLYDTKSFNSLIALNTYGG